jgi:chromosome segregation ATPase
MSDEAGTRARREEQRGNEKDREELESVLAVEHAWLRLKRENEDLRRQNEVLSETVQYLQEKLNEQEGRLPQIDGVLRDAEERLKNERREREMLEWEMEQLRERLHQAVNMVAGQRSGGWWTRILPKNNR